MKLPSLNAQAVLAFVVVLAFIVLVGIWMVLPPTFGDDKIATMVNALVMMVGTGFLTVVNYYFGSSSGSKDKDETLSKIAASAPAQLPASVIVPPAAP